MQHKIIVEGAAKTVQWLRELRAEYLVIEPTSRRLVDEIRLEHLKAIADCFNKI